MKTKFRQSKNLRAARRKNRLGQTALGASLLTIVAQIMAAGTNSVTPAQLYEGGTNTYNNWIELSSGALMTQGNKTQASQGQQLNTGVFGGIEDMHYETDVAKKTTFTIDGRSIANQNDYNLGLSLVKSFVELHGGRIEITSAPGQGTRVTCFVPTRSMPALEHAAG